MTHLVLNLDGEIFGNGFGEVRRNMIESRMHRDACQSQGELITQECNGMTGADNRCINVMLLVGSLERGGAERQVVALANGLDRSRFCVHVCSLSSSNPLGSDVSEPEHLHVVDKRWKYDFSSASRVARLLRQLHIDVVHCFLFKAEMVGRLAGRLAGTPAVIASNRCPHFLHHKLMLWASRATAKYFDIMVANSWAGRDFEITSQGIDPTKVVVIPNGVDTNRFRPTDASQKRAELGVDPNAKVVGMFAHFRGNKNHAMFLEAAARVSATFPEAVFLCVGRADGEAGQALYASATRLVASRGIGDRVLFLGERNDVVDLYNICDIKVLASFYEGTANVLLEAMACGLPVIATDAGDNARVVVEGETGFIVGIDGLDALTDRLGRLLMDDTLRRQMGRAGRLHVEQEFSIPAMARKTGDLYIHVLHSKGMPKH